VRGEGEEKVFFFFFFLKKKEKKTRGRSVREGEGGRKKKPRFGVREKFDVLCSF
jgi:hypothetical protein